MVALKQYDIQEGKVEVEIISVVVPIYNMEQYLARCIESIIGQTYKELEILLVNDGSTDRCLEICQLYAEKDSRIKVIDKPNEGVAIARNAGLSAATGEYVCFVDPDDWIENSMYEVLYRALKKHHVSVCLCDFFKDTKRRSVPECFDFSEEYLDKEEIIKLLIGNMIGIEDISFKSTYIMGCAWRGLYNLNKLREWKINFIDHLSIMEDLVFMVKLLLKCDQIAVVHQPYYHYVQNPKSSLHTYNQKMWEDQMLVFKELEQLICEAGLEKEMRTRLDMRYVSMVLCSIKNETYSHSGMDLKTTFGSIKKLCMDEQLRVVLERVNPLQKPNSKVKKETKDKKEKKLNPKHSATASLKEYKRISERKSLRDKEALKEKKQTQKRKGKVTLSERKDKGLEG